MIQHHKICYEKLIPFGFYKQDGICTYETEILDGQFRMIVIVKDEGFISTLIDTMTDEKYTLHLVEEAEGEFVGMVRKEHDEVILRIVSSCCTFDAFQTDTARKLISYVKDKYGDELEFLWDDFDGAVWRRKDNRKWYAVVMNILPSKIGHVGKVKIPVIGLRMETSQIETLLDHKTIFPGYHMNKKHWITIPLDDTVELEIICRFVNESYALANPKNKKKLICLLFYLFAFLFLIC